MRWKGMVMVQSYTMRKQHSRHQKRPIYSPLWPCKIYHDISRNRQAGPRFKSIAFISYIRYIFGTYSHKTIYFFENDIFLKNIPNISYMRYINFQKYIIYTIYFSRSAFGRAKSRYMKYIIYMIYSTLKITLVHTPLAPLPPIDLRGLPKSGARPFFSGAWDSAGRMIGAKILWVSERSWKIMFLRWLQVSCNGTELWKRNTRFTSMFVSSPKTQSTR